MKFFIKIVLIVLFLGATLFSQDVATVTGLTGKAFVERSGKKIDVTLGFELGEKDTIVTNGKAKVQIIFKDETLVTVGKNSKFSIDEYLFEENQESVAKFAILKGAMRTITGRIGKIAPDRFSVKAKTATIGIRGTNFTALVDEDDTVRVYCTYGAISVTVNGVEYIVKQGYYITISPDGTVEIKSFTAQDLKEMKDENFGKSEFKRGDGSEEGMAQLDNTMEDDADLVIKDITETNADSIQTVTAGIEAYTMSDALYTGTFTQTSMTGSTPALPANGTAELEVDFGADTVVLTLNPGGPGEVMFDQNTVFNGNTFTVDQHTHTGNADGVFEGATGNTVNGNYFNDEGAGTTTTGIYNVTSPQVLH